ncbi:hypothetical protein HZZ00_11095 [Streptomyces sp. NEAU-sy36]|uniref:hypothetical protein n=1 Tax=unclassified Streptomyces TaxID=2593676 RepID=UPI0015D5985E|nr:MULTISPECIES: hypothetical protein [unclassified Streptomyces]QLJ01517.1 hypothetical protein HZZ00_11095 [Streptomyces sp. NEAU-sy36]
MTNIGDPGYERELKSALEVADALREATQPNCPQSGSSGPATTHDAATNSTTTVHGDHHGVTGGTHHGDQYFHYKR